MSLVGILVAVLIVCLIAYLINLAPLPQPAKTIFMVVLAVVLLLWLLGALGGGPGLHLSAL